MVKQNLKFRFSGKMARLLGRESVSSDVAALFELVKNAYDADATKVRVCFENMKSKAGIEAITVEDNGHGMTVDGIVNKWMVIGTDDKERNEITRKGRRMVGNKGVGRFSTEKLAHDVTLVSRPEGKPERSTLKVNWDDYEGENITFGDVENTLETTETESNTKDHGAKLTLTRLRTEWTEQKITRLQKAVSALILPKEIQQLRDEPFDVEIQAEEFGSFKKTQIDSGLFDAAPYKIVAAIMEGSNTCTPKIYKEGKIVRQVPIDMSDVELDGDEKWINFGRCKVTIYFYPERNRYEPWDEHYKKTLNVSKIASLIRDLNGVKIYRDKFWVRPYGGDGNDWLDLEASRVQSFLRTGNSRLIGFVEITKEGNSGIVDTTTRERLDENAHYKSMKKFVSKVIDELYYYRIEVFKQLRGEAKKQKHKNVVESELRHLAELVDQQPIPKPSKREIGKSISEVHRTFINFEKDTKEEYELLEIAERAYRNLASLGISTASTLHEILNLINNFEEIPDSIKNTMNENAWIDGSITKDLEDAKSFIEYLKHYAWFNRSFVQNIAGGKLKSKRGHKIAIKNYLDRMKGTFTEILSDVYDIEYRVNPPSLSIYMNKADFTSIMLNLLSNSLNALDAQKGLAEKKIRITFYRDARNLKIEFSDNGKGISDGDRGKIFDLFFTTKAKGTGLGLAIVSEIVELYGGKIDLSTTSEMAGGATFIITIPWEEICK